jgi:hypothetical protein
MSGTWEHCGSLVNVAVPNTSNWQVSVLGGHFLDSTWQDCESLVSAAVPDTSNWPIDSIGRGFLNSTWQDCDSLVSAVVPNTKNWKVEVIDEDFLHNTWEGCAALKNAVVPDTSNWPVKSVGDYFLDSTWANCTALKNISNLKFSNSFETVSGFLGGFNWYQTFALPNDDPTTTGAQPSLYNGTLITALGNPLDDRETFRGRTGMVGYESLNENWK